MTHSGTARRTPMAAEGLADRIVHLTQVALCAPDLPSGIEPTLDVLIQDTAAVGSAYFHLEAQDLTFRVRAAAGALPDGPAMQAIVTHGLPAGLPLLQALRDSPVPLYFEDTGASPVSAGFPELGVASLAAAPVRAASGELLGAFLMHTFVPHEWHPDERRLFRSIGATLATLGGRLTAERQAHTAREAALRALGLALEARDQETQGHTDRVTALTVRLAERLGWTGEHLQALRWGAYLHDVGKIAIPDRILLKRGSLTLSERQAMQRHVPEGLRFAQALGFLPPVALHVIQDHHEQWSGRGYPHGRRGTDISEAGRIFALCDVYDALTSTRPYKAAWSAQEAVAELQAQAGRHFDPDLLPVFLDLLAEGTTAQPTETGASTGGPGHAPRRADRR
ncbi:HD domain-containing phosphohydrolase [Deinococcus sedimenti]|uniref:Phosphohydrolase n=1 Tax=Deinococcus sedimenti TaxID=1867090 RepID=A0ABQ2S954_9DEIO|nr:HD domain-containing phosphohydrolase [Deinococcus sedimenti]GGS10027.1 phosphohydrolase [Deinococcus sedimenti]